LEQIGVGLPFEGFNNEIIKDELIEEYIKQAEQKVKIIKKIV
jgi:hypothetical protein